MKEASLQSSRRPRQLALTGCASHTTVRTDHVYGGSLNSVKALFTPYTLHRLQGTYGGP